MKILFFRYLLQLIVFIRLPGVRCYFTNPIQAENSSWQPLFSEIFSQFQNYTKFIHFGNSSIEIIPKTPDYHANVLINYDIEMKGLIPIKERPAIHIILDNTVLFELRMNFSSLLWADDAVFIITDIKYNYCLAQHLIQAGIVIIYNSRTGKSSYCCFYCGEKFSKKKIRNLNGQRPKYDMYINKYTNFMGYRFKVGCSEMVPFIFRQ